MSMDPDRATALLAARRAELEAHSALSAGSRETVALDQQAVGRLSRMDAMQAQAMAAAQERTRRRELQRIAAAERRLTAGDYGLCEDCGEPIPEGRLRIDPAAERCTGCAG